MKDRTTAARDVISQTGVVLDHGRLFRVSESMAFDKVII